MLGQVMLLLSLAAPGLRADAARCERAYCRCIPPAGSAEEIARAQRERATRVVLGRVVRIDSLATHLVPHGPASVGVRQLAARVAVSRVWKGPPVDTLTVVFGSTPVASSCDLSLQAGSSYVIFALADDDGALRTRQCTGTAAEVDARATISALGPGRVPGKSTRRGSGASRP
jgi:hypothetical protein